MPSLPAACFQAFDSLASLLAVTRSDGRIVFSNSALEDALATSRRVLCDLSLAAFVVDPPALLNALHTARGVASWHGEAALKRSGAEPLLVHVLITPSEAPDLWVVEMLPLGQQARQWRDDRLLELTQTHKELVRNLAHEIKNPLGGLRGAAQLLEMELPTPALREYTQVIIAEADRLQSLVDRLLEPHRHPHQIAEVNIHEVCEYVATLVQAEFPHGLKVLREYDTSIPELQADRQQLVQVFLNIVRNACQALLPQMQSGDACLTLRTHVARQVTLGKQRHRLAVVVHVIDNGPGIAPDLQERIFYPLVSGRDGGSGLGLTLAQTFVQQHHGMITFDSVPGRTDFKIWIPLP